MRAPDGDVDDSKELEKSFPFPIPFLRVTRDPRGRARREQPSNRASRPIRLRGLLDRPTAEIPKFYHPTLTPNALPVILLPWREHAIFHEMRIIAKRTLRQFWETHERGDNAETPLEVWHSIVAQADWASPADVKEAYGDASILKNSRVVFNIGGNKYRMAVLINYPYRIVYIRFLGTHGEYDAIDAESI